MPKVSVIMSVFNDEKNVAESVKSILNQTFDDFEFMIVNDGSTDDSMKIVHSLKDPRIRTIQHENIGLTKSLNKAICVSQSEYIARQDSDDISIPDRLEKQVSFLDNNPEYAMIGTGIYRINSYGRIIETPSVISSNRKIRWFLRTGNCFCHGSVMIRRSSLNHVGIYRDYLKVTQDYDLWRRISEAYKVENLRERLYLWRKNKQNISFREREVQDKTAALIGAFSCERSLNGIDSYRLLADCHGDIDYLIRMKATNDYRHWYNIALGDVYLRSKRPHLAKKQYKRCLNEKIEFYTLLRLLFVINTEIYSIARSIGIKVLR